MMSTFLKAHKRAYGVEHIRPKHHYAMHSAIQAQESGRTFVDCFVHERKHQVMKRCADAIKNTRTFEASVLGRVLLEQCRQVTSAPPSRTILGGVQPCPFLQAPLMASTVNIGKGLVYDGLQVKVDDIVMFGEQVGKVVACASADDRLVLVVQSFRRMRGEKTRSQWATQAAKCTRKKHMPRA